ncbi:MAG: cofactor-independent phosphoglycerate mutase [Candidatus Hecatellales archaeon]|nr:MAG: cofactor-independent phosphoglycerate mutase [Candidatus Hecatellales archaeon]
MKFMLVIGDGMSDEVRPGTPLAEAYHPYMDFIASNGLCGLLDTVPEGFPPSSEVAIMNILGYDPRRYQISRGPLEAAGLKIRLREGEIALRCNLVTVREGRLVDYSAGHISTEEAAELLEALEKERIGGGALSFHVGVSYRHVAVLKGGSEALECYPPHDHMGEPLDRLKIKALSGEAEASARLLNKVSEESFKILSRHPVNLEREKKGKNPGNMVWFWAPGGRPNLPPFMQAFNLDGAAISAVNVVKGLAFLLGMQVIEVPGATGYLDTNHEGKAEAALKALDSYDFVLVHVEAPDEAAHQGDFKLKVKAIEDLDERLLRRLVEGLEERREEFAIAVLPDHATPVNVKTHTRDPVPFAFYTFPPRPGRVRPAERFDEVSASRTGLRLEASKFMSFFLGRGFP